MVIPIDAIRYGADFDATSGWYDPPADHATGRERRQAAEVLAPARGALCGLLLSGALWLGLVALVRAVW